MSEPRDYMKYNPGDMDPILGKKIETLILRSSAGFIVYLDEDSVVQWSYTCEVSNDLGSVFNRVSSLETASDFLKGTEHLKPIRAMIAEGVARMLDSRDLKSANEILNQAEQLIALRNREYSRRWFFASSLISTAIFFLLFVLFVFNRGQFIVLTSQNAFVVVTTALLGSLGAIVSVCLRNEDLHLDANAGLSLHVLEGFARVFIGVSAGLVLALLTKGGLILEIIQKSEHSIYLFWAFGLLAGASERILPGFIAKADGMALNSHGERK
jgi:hypothetical protein